MIQTISLSKIAVHIGQYEIKTRFNLIKCFHIAPEINVT